MESMSHRAAQGFWEFWTDQFHPLVYAVAFSVVFAVVSGQYKIFIPVAVFAIALDLEVSYRKWRRDQHRS